MNNYSTELPPNFKTWNEFLKHIDAPYQHSTVLREYIEDGKMWQCDYVKARCFDEIMDNKITRVEVINHQDNKGRDFAKCGCDNVELHLQDDGRTLKIFITATH